MARSNTITHGVDGHYIIQMNLTSSTAVSITEFLSFNLIEETSNLLPSFEISFIAGGGLEEEWNERTPIPLVLSTSTTSSEKLETTLQLVHPNIVDAGQGLKCYSATGTFYAPAFLQTPHLNTVSSCNGTDVLKEIGSKYFKVDKRCSSQEQQPWYQTNTTDKKFLDYVMSRCYIKDSFVYCGITSSGEYIICDPVQESGNSAKYTLSEAPGQGEFGLLATPRFNSKSGFMNSIGGYGMDTPIISQDSGVRTVHRPGIKFNFVENDHSRIDNVQRRTTPPVKVSMSSDPKSTMGYSNFNTGTALLSMESAEVAVLSNYFPIKIFDIVELKTPELRDPGLNINFSGKYMVTKVARTIQKGLFLTHVSLSRDAHNKSK